jgi:rRNA maturation endonuclease Nob1
MLKDNNWTYMRRCKRCGEIFEATAKYSKICNNCKKNTGGRIWKIIQNSTNATDVEK